MMKKDEQIKKIFEDYGDDLQANESLSYKARLAMAASDGKRSSLSSEKHSRKILVWIIPVCAILIVAAVLFGLPVFGGNSNVLPDNTENNFLQSNVEYYSAVDVKGKAVRFEECNSVLKLDSINKNGEFQIVSADCYAFYSDNDEFVYYKLFLGVRSADGTFTELKIVAEKDGFVHADFAEIYREASKNDQNLFYADYDESGEYVTHAFFAARNFHFYVWGRNGQPSSDVEKIIKNLLD